MKSLLILVLLVTAATAQAETSKEDRMAQDLTRAFCEQRHKYNDNLIRFCLKTQLATLRKLGEYQAVYWPKAMVKVDGKPSHPVGRLFLHAVKESSVVAAGKPWVDWGMANLRFKQYMEAWLIAEGKEIKIVTLKNKL